MDRRYQKQKTTILTQAQALSSRKWFLFDAKGKTLGRLSSEIAKILRGKHRRDFTSHVDCGDGVVIINAEQVAVTGMKEARKLYKDYTGYIGGLREPPLSTMRARHPTRILMRAIKGMMPKTRLGDQQLRKLSIFSGSEHTMQAQNPVPVTI